MVIDNINYNELLLSFRVKPNGVMSLFIGAGTSAAAGISTARAMVWEFKRMLYCISTNTNEEMYRDIQSESNRSVIQSYFDSLGGYPKLDCSEEYSFYFERCFPLSIDRRHFIQNRVKNINPSFGHRCIGALIKNKKVDHVWTTNFDELVEKGIRAVDLTLSFEVITPETHTYTLPPINDLPKILKLHGDFRYDVLQNTADETKAINIKLEEYFKHCAKSGGIIIVGYSGSDTSVMTILMDMAKEQNSFPAGMIWAIRKNETPSSAVIRLMETAKSNNPAGMTGIVEIESADQFFYDLYKQIAVSESQIEGIASELFNNRIIFTAHQFPSTENPIKINAIKIIGYPKSVWKFKSSVSDWKELKILIDASPIVATLHGGDTYALGKKDDIVTVFGPKLLSDLIAVDVEDRWFIRENSFIYGLFYDLMTKGFTYNYRLGASGFDQNSRKFYDKNEILERRGSICIYKAFEIHLEYRNEILWLLLVPTVFVIDIKKQTSKLDRQSHTNRVISNMYNKSYSEHLKFWMDKLSMGGKEIHLGCEGANILLESKFAYAQSKPSTAYHTFTLGSQREEPRLYFNPLRNDYCSIHPLKGLRNYAPYDSNLLSRDIAGSDIKLALIVPQSDFGVVQKHLRSLTAKILPTSEKEYLIPYDGFSSIFKRSINIPDDIKDNLCVTISDTELSKLSILEFYDVLKRKIEYFVALRGSFDILIIYIPGRWSSYREQKDEHVFFDLHDSLKLFCAKKAIKIQIIEEKSLQYPDHAKVNWWLSLGLYVKANGVPWKNQYGSSKSAFIGLGYSSKKVNGKTEMIVGCSQLFDSSGQGLRFMLHPIDTPIYKGKNPFMNRDDARLLVNRLKEAYFSMDPNNKLERVTIHKTTHFIKEEIDGIAEALDGIPEVELLQIQQHTFWRAVRSKKRTEGGYDAHNYPIERGKVIQIDDFSFLLWTHGAVANRELEEGNKIYYQGKRGIPAPLLIRRFRGRDSIENIADQILSLTKMNWNSGGLYKTLPVTLDFSKRISGMAKQVEGFPPRPYDFRFFM